MCHICSAIPLFALFASFVLAGENRHALAQERLALKRAKVQSLAFSPDGKVLALGRHDGTIVLVDPATGKEQGRLAGHTEIVKSLAFSPDGKTLVSGSQDKTIRLWDVAARREKAVLKGHEGAPTCVAFSPDGKVLASAGGPDKTVRLWNPMTGRELKVFRGHTGAVLNVAFLEGGKTLVSTSSTADKNSIKIWDAETAQERKIDRKFAESYQIGFKCMTAAPDGKSFATGSYDDTVKIRDVNTAKGTEVLRGEGGAAFSLAYSANGELLAAGRFDGEVTIWNVAAGYRQAELKAHSNAVKSVSLDPQGKTLATVGDDDGTVKIWDVAKLRSTDNLAARRRDAVMIRGAWKVVSAKQTAEFDENIDVNDYKDSVWTFGEKELTVRKGKTETKLAYGIDPSKQPKQIEIGENLAGDDEDRPFLGIYELNGDKLTICYIIFNVRPSEFDMPRGIAVTKRLIMLERQKK